MWNVVVLLLAGIFPSANTMVDSSGFALGKGCVGDVFYMSEVGSNKNLLGGWWYTFADTGIGTPDSLRGNSSIEPSELGEFVTDSGFRLTANLDRRFEGVYRSNGGWVSLGTGFQSGGRDRPKNLSGVTGISFNLNYDASFDTANVGMELRIGVDSPRVEYYRTLPTKQRGFICVDPLEFRPVDGNFNVDSTLRAINLKKTSNFRWHMFLRPSADSTLVASAGNLLELGDVSLWTNCSDREKVRPELCNYVSLQPRKGGIGLQSLKARYQNGLHLTFGASHHAPIQATVRQLDGRRVGSWTVALQGNSVRVPVRLGQGTYLVQLRGQGVSATAQMAVLAQ